MKPEHQHVAITMEDGRVLVMAFVTKGKFTEGIREIEATDEAIQAEIDKAKKVWRDSDIGKVKNWRRIKESEIPEDRTFRDAFRDNGKKIVHDMAHAKEIHRDRLRRAREPQLQALDVAYQRVLEHGGDTAAVVKEKQALRDVTDHPEIEKAKMPEALKAVWPKELEA